MTGSRSFSLTSNIAVSTHGYSFEWSGALEVYSIYVSGIAGYLREFNVTVNTVTETVNIYARLTSTDSSTTNRDYASALEIYNSSFVIAQGGRSAVIPGPNYSGNTSSDSTGPYVWTLDFDDYGQDLVSPFVESIL